MPEILKILVVMIDIQHRCLSIFLFVIEKSYNEQRKTWRYYHEKVVEFLQANPVQYLATVGRDGKAKCRPFMFCFEKDGKLWFCTNNTKDVYKDMQANQNPRFLFPSRNMHGFVCIVGWLYLENNMAVRKVQC